jgi:hypothetical protein
MSILQFADFNQEITTLKRTALVLSACPAEEQLAAACVQFILADSQLVVGFVG